MAQSRYEFSKVVLRKKPNEEDSETPGYRTFETTLMPDIPESNEDIYIYTREGDRLDLLAYEYYGDAEYWWILAQANHIKGSWAIKPGTRFRIPPAVGLIYEDIDTYNRSR